MTNKYLLKIAIAQDEKDSLKTFGKASLGGWAAHIGGAAVGAAGLAALAKNNKRVAGWAAKAINKGNTISSKFSGSGVGRVVKKYMGHGPAAVAGGIAGGVVGEEIANYAAIRHGIKQTRQNQIQEGQTKQAEEMTNKYLEKIAKKMTERELNGHAWGGTGYGMAGGIAAGIIPGGTLVGNAAGIEYKLNKLSPTKNHVGRAARGLGRSLLGQLGGSLAGAGAGGGIGAGIGGAVGALKGKASEGAKIGAAIGGIGGLVSGTVKGTQVGVRHHYRVELAKKGKK